jgi:phosphoserine phosphatase RsbU/P
VAVQSAADAASRAILRPLPATLSGVPVSVDYLSAFEAARVGGDLYEGVPTEHGLRLVIGDVRGKGLEAVRLAALTLGSFREAAHREDDLHLVAAAMHAAVVRDADPEDFVTALLVQVSTDTVQMLSCGHPTPILVRAGSATDLPLPENPPLGIGGPGRPVTVPLHAGDRVLLYTDGAIEARKAGRFFDLHSAAATALAAGGLSSAVARLSGQVRAHTGSGQTDDVAFLAFELPPDFDARDGAHRVPAAR